MGNPFSFTQYFGYRNFLCMRTENQVFLPNILCLTIQKKSLLSFRFFGISKTLCHILIFRQIFSSHSTEKLRQDPSNVSKSSKCEVSKKIVSKSGISRFSVENFLAQSAEGIRCETLRYIRKVRLSKKFMPKRLISLFSVEFMHVYCL